MYSGYTQIVTDEFTRPANVTAYDAKDVIGPATAAVGILLNIGRFPASSGYVTKARLVTDNKSAGNRVRVWLYTAPPTAISDNAPFALLYANRAERIGFIDLPALASEDAASSDCASAMNADIRVSFSMAAGSKNLHYVLETLDAVTPNSGQKYFLELTAELN
jgi:hypothetical protein